MILSKSHSVLQWLCLIACLLIIFSMGSCKAPVDKKAASIINTDHLDHLYAEILMNADTVGIIHIYSEYPDYKFVGDADEGMACVDDISRAAIFYLRQFELTKSPASLHKAEKLLKFLLHMQAENGYYYNFIWPDGKINTDGKTSKAEPSWWSWRTLWAFGVAVDILPEENSLVNLILQQRRRLVQNILQDSAFLQNATDTAKGITIPTWLPKGSGTDQASLVILGLNYVLQETPTEAIKNFMRHFADGIMMMQVHQPDSLEDGAFLSWENLWHAYGNMQSYALLKAGSAINDSSMITAANTEITKFYPRLQKQADWSISGCEGTEKRSAGMISNHSIKSLTANPQ